MHLPVRRARRGFTLVELMVVVTIIAVLAAVAIPTFRQYVFRARASEATTFLAEIRARQEAYRMEHGQYCAVSGSTWGVWAPTSAVVAGQSQAWEPTDEWRALGARPDTAVRFQYAAIAGPPGTTPPDGLGYTGNDFWHVAQALGDLDGDGTTVTFEAYSASSNIWVSDPNGWE